MQVILKKKLEKQGATKVLGETNVLRKKKKRKIAKKVKSKLKKIAKKVKSKVKKIAKKVKSKKIKRKVGKVTKNSKRKVGKVFKKGIKRFKKGRKNFKGGRRIFKGGRRIFRVAARSKRRIGKARRKIPIKYARRIGTKFNMQNFPKKERKIVGDIIIEVSLRYILSDSRCPCERFNSSVEGGLEKVGERCLELLSEKCVGQPNAPAVEVRQVKDEIKSMTEKMIETKAKIDNVEKELSTLLNQ